MLRDHRPYRIKKAYLKFTEFYVEHFLRPQFASFGKGHTFIRPWHVEIFGAPIRVGNYVNVIAARDRKVRLTVWSDREDPAGIRVGDYCLICPGVRMSSAVEIVVGDNCMFATNAYITDSDWHDIYNRVAIVGKSGPVRIGNNVWVGDSAIVCKGVNIGENSAYTEDEVVLIGSQDDARITVEDLAEWAGTIPYEILTNINTRVPRIYKRRDS